MSLNDFRTRNTKRSTRGLKILLFAHFLKLLDEYEVLAKYLSLPSRPSQLLNPASLGLQSLVRKCVDHPRVHTMLKPTAKPGVVTYPLKLNSLIPLPHDYSDLINSISGFTCPKVCYPNIKRQHS